MLTFLVLFTNGFYKGMVFGYILLRFLILIEIFVIIRKKELLTPKTVIPIALTALIILPAIIFQFFFCKTIQSNGKTGRIEFITFDYQLCKKNLKDIGTALDLYAADNSRLYPDKLSLLENKYMWTLPRCVRENITPQTGNTFEVFNRINTDGYGYNVSKDRTAYTIYCRKNNHSQINIGENFPQFSLEENDISTEH